MGKGTFYKQVILMRLPVDTLVQRYHQNLYVVAYSVCSNREDAEEAAQDAFIQYHISKKEFDSEEHIRAWLFVPGSSASRSTKQKTPRKASGGAIAQALRTSSPHSALRARKRLRCSKQ